LDFLLLLSWRRRKAITGSFFLPSALFPKAHSVSFFVFWRQDKRRTSAMRGDLAEGGGGLLTAAGAAAESVDDARVATTRGDRRSEGARERGGAATTTTGATAREDDSVGAANAATRGEAEREARMAFAS
jgi:hypothetical protein